MRIANVYSPGVFTCSASDSLPEVARKMAIAGVGALAVVDDEADLVGIISERDLTAALAHEADPRSVRAVVYTSSSVQTAGVDEQTSDVARRMLDAGIRHLPVVVDGRVTGMLSMRDLLTFEAWV